MITKYKSNHLVAKFKEFILRFSETMRQAFEKGQHKARALLAW